MQTETVIWCNPIYEPAKKWKTRHKRTMRPSAYIYWNILRNAGRTLCVCECCGSKESITVHHLDGNPYNNIVENLKVICWNCHKKIHYSTRDDLDGITPDYDILDDPEIREFYGIIQEEEILEEE